MAVVRADGRRRPPAPTRTGRPAGTVLVEDTVAPFYLPPPEPSGRAWTSGTTTKGSSIPSSTAAARTTARATAASTCCSKMDESTYAEADGSDGSQTTITRSRGAIASTVGARGTRAWGTPRPRTSRPNFLKHVLGGLEIAVAWVPGRGVRQPGAGRHRVREPGVRNRAADNDVLGRRHRSRRRRSARTRGTSTATGRPTRRRRARSARTRPRGSTRRR